MLVILRTLCYWLNLASQSFGQTQRSHSSDVSSYFTTASDFGPYCRPMQTRADLCRPPLNGPQDPPGPQEFFTKAKFEKKDLVYMSTFISLSVKEKYMQTHAEQCRPPLNGPQDPRGHCQRAP